MSNRLFQGIIHQMKDTVNRTIGVVDENGIVISCNELLVYTKEINKIIKWSKNSNMKMQNYRTALSLISKYQKEET